MFRLLGILLGSAIAVAILILLVGIPQIDGDDESEPVSVKLPLQAEPVARTEPAADTPVQVTTATAPKPELPTPIAAEPDPEPEAEPEPEAAPFAVNEPTPAPIVETDELHWYAFWSPFRSQIAANGFVARLQQVTGLDYRVVSVKPGVYEVAFAYSDDDEIQANLSTISAATGLNVPES